MNDRMIEKINNWGVFTGISGVVIALIGVFTSFFRELPGVILLFVGAFILLAVCPAFLKVLQDLENHRITIDDDTK